MANCYFRGDTPAVAQVNTVTVGGTAANGQVYSITINGKVASYTANGSDTNASITAALLVSIQNAQSSILELAEMTWASPTATTLTATANTPGYDFAFTSSATGTGTLVTSTTTANKSPNDWSLASNWSGGSVPATGDSVYLRSSSVNITQGLSQSGVTLALLDIDSTYTGQIGLPDINVSGGATSGYSEYRGVYLAISATKINVGRGTGQGSSLIRLNVGSNQCTLNIYATSSPPSQGAYVVDFLGTHASNAVNASRGSFMVAGKPGTTSTISVANIGSQGSPASDVQALFGDGCTLGTVLQEAGTVQYNCSLTTLTIASGIAQILGTSTIGTAVNFAGVLNYDTSGTLGSYTGGNGSLIDFSRVNVARTVSACTLNYGASYNDPGKTATVSGSGIKVSCAFEQLGPIDFGQGRYILVS